MYLGLQSNPRAQLNRELSSQGIGWRYLHSEEETGSITKILIGSAANATVLTLEQQPGHEPHAYIQEATYRRDFHVHGKEDLSHRPTGQAFPISLELASVIVIFANKVGNLPAGQLGVDAVTGPLLSQATPRSE